jgi:AcrR family transcriptional regulator
MISVIPFRYFFLTVHASVVTMNQKHSLIKCAYLARKALTSDTAWYAIDLYHAVFKRLHASTDQQSTETKKLRREKMAEKHVNQSNVTNKSSKFRSRDAARTQAEILAVAVDEFAEHGFHGARVDRITKAAKCNSRMIYHYFGGKEQLYIAALENIFRQIRDQEAQLNFSEGNPATKVNELVEFTFDYFKNNANFRKMTRNENALNGVYIARSAMMRNISEPIIVAISDLVERGFSSGAFSRKPDPVQLYLSIVAISAHHLNNAATLGIVVGQDLLNEDWQEERRKHAIDLILSYLGIQNR